MSAVISPCGQYRYRPERDVPMDGLTFAFFGVNPSTADATLDDATVRKWIGFTKVNGGRRLIVGNVFAVRSTDVHEQQQTLAVRGYRGRPSTVSGALLQSSYSAGLRSGTGSAGMLDSHADQRPAGDPLDVFCFTQQPQDVHRYRT